MTVVENFNIKNIDMDYHIRNWTEFTTLMDDEQYSLSKLYWIISGKINKEKEQNKPIFCKETGQFYSSITECSKKLNISKVTIWKAIKNKRKVLKKYSLSFVL